LLLLAQLLPGRAEFGGLVTNLLHEMAGAGVEVRTSSQVDRAMIESESPDVVVMATGAIPYRPSFASEGALQIADAWQILRESVEPGHSVVVVDWRADWIGIGIAERLAQSGRRVRLAVSGIAAGESLPFYVRDASVAALHKLGVSVLPYMRLYGSDSDTVYLQHVTSGEAVVIESVDTLVLCTGHQSVTDLADTLDELSLDVRIIGDAASPRTAEEAVFEGLRVATEI